MGFSGLVETNDGIINVNEHNMIQNANWQVACEQVRTGRAKTGKQTNWQEEDQMVKTRITGHTSNGNVPNGYPNRGDKMIVIL